MAAPPALADGGDLTMYDASVTNISDIPSNAQMVAGGDAWTQSDFGRFPNALHVTIACKDGDISNGNDMVFDFESKCSTSTSTLKTWIEDHQKDGLGLGTVYSDKGNLPTVLSTLQQNNLHVYLWIEDQTGTQHTYTCNITNCSYGTVVATQWCGYISSSGYCLVNGQVNSHVDESLVTNPAALTGVTIPILRGKTAANSGSSFSGSTITVNLPAGYKAGDMLIIWLVWNGVGTTPTLSGWTSYPKSTGTIGVQMFTRVATGAEGSSVTINFAAGFVYSVLCADYENVKSAAPLDPAPPNSGQVNAASSTITVPGVTTTLANDELVWFGATTGPSGATPGTITVPSGFTAEVPQNNSTSPSNRNSGTILADRLMATAGATGNQDGTSSTSVINAGILVSLAAG